MRWFRRGYTTAEQETSGGARDDVGRKDRATGGREVDAAGQLIRGDPTLVDATGGVGQRTRAPVDLEVSFETETVSQSGLKLGILSVEKEIAEISSSVNTSRYESSRRRWQVGRCMQFT